MSNGYFAPSTSSAGAGSPFVGRQQEMQTLFGLLSDASQGSGRVIMLSGEPGIGKTALLHEFARMARSAGWRALLGQAYDSEGMPPYLPFTEALREHVVSATDAEVAALPPEVAALIPNLQVRVPRAEHRQYFDAASERYRSFEAVCSWFADLAHRPGSCGLLLGIEDIHWADEPTLLLLEHLARGLHKSPILLAITYRDTEVKPGRPLARTLEQLARVGNTEVRSLRPFDAVGVAKLLEALSGAHPPRPVVDAVYGETEGNPLFVREIYQYLASEGRLFDEQGHWRPRLRIDEAEVPQGIQMVIGRRFQRLSEDCRHALTVASIIGRVFDFELLRRVSGAGEAALLGAMDEAAQAHLIAIGQAVDAEAHLVFTHELIRQTLVSDLSLPHRRALHLAVAEAIEEMHADDLVPFSAELAHHFRLSSVAPVKTIEYSKRAAGAALVTFAWEDAARHLEVAIHTLDRIDGSDSERCDLLIGLIGTLMSAGRWDQIITSTAPLAYQLAESLQDQERMGAVARTAVDALGQLAGAAGLTTAAGSLWLERASALTAEGTPERIFVDQRAAARLDGMGRQNVEANVENYRAARALADREALFTAAVGPLNGPTASPGLLHLSQSVLREMAEEPSEGVSPPTLAKFLGRAAECHLLFGDRAAFDRTRDRMLGIANQSRDSFVSDSCTLVELIRCILEGDLERGSELLETPGFDSVFHVFVSRVHGARMNLWLGRSAQVQGMLEGIPEYFRSEAAPQIWRPARAWLLAALGRAEEARNELRQWLTEAEPVEAAKIWEIVGALDAAVLLRDPDLARQLTTPLEPVAHLAIGGFLALVSVGRLVGASQELQGNHDSARSYYEVALAAAQEVRFRPETALIRLHLGELLVRHYPSQREAAFALLDLAIADLGAMGMQPSLERALRMRGRRARSARTEAFPGRLTIREVEVLRLLADGCTSKEIGDELVLSVRTVERHIANIYLKTGTHSRVAAVNYAGAHGLLPPGLSL